MTPWNRFASLFAILALSLAAACTSGTDSPAGNTEINLDIRNPGSTSGELGFSVDRVDYRITCPGNVPGTYPIPDADTIGTDYPYDDSVDISGAFEIVDTRTPPVWQTVMDLPPGDCTITLSVYEDDEIVCVGSQTLAILEDGVTKYDIVLVCSLSIDSPDGMADVDGDFEFITGNLCPKLYLVNAIPSNVPNDNSCTATQLPCVTDADCQPPAPGGIPGQLCNVNTEIQFRTKDPDNTCGNNCDPQTCDFSNPPVCSPYPSNFLDPNCHPSAGGDPNDPACLAGDHAGLVCQVTGIPQATGAPGGTWIDPNDQLTPLGLPSFLVNLNTVAGIPGIVLPGLGGPAGYPAADSPAYPPLPNTNGSLPPLRYVCDTTIPGAVTIQIVCTDGDLECTQVKTATITCPGTNQCTVDPIPDCSAPHDCASGGTGSDTGVPGCDPLCAPVCDPSSASYDPVACAAEPPPNNVDCERCPGQGTYLPDGTACQTGEFGTTGNVCLLGFCVECLINENDPPNGNPNCDATPVDCLEPSYCASNACQARAASPAGTPCSNGVCDGGGNGPADCQFVAIDPCSGTADPGCDPATGIGCAPDDPQLCEQVITVGCGNNVTADVSILPYLLRVDPTEVVASTAFTATIDGVAEFSESFLDAARGAVPGGVTKASLVDLIATVQTRGDGATGADVPVTAGSTIPYECVLGDTGPGAQQPCDPANDQPSVPGVRGNTDCIPTGTFNPCGRIVTVPTSNDCAAGGVCETAGKASQCTANGFCVTGGLPLPLDPAAGSYTAGDGVTPGQTSALFGWYDTPADASPGVGTPPIDGDGTYNIQAPTYSGVAGVVGLAVNAGGLAVQLECVMAVDSGGPDGVGVPDDASPTPDTSLLGFTVQVP